MSKNDDEVLVRVEGVSKKFCRSLKKSLWYGVCDIAGELLPGRKRRETRDEGRGSRVEGRGSRVESYQIHQLKTSAARLWTLDARPLPRQPSTLDPRRSTPLAPPLRSTLDPRPSTPRTVSVRANSTPSRMSASNCAEVNALGSSGITGREST